MKVKTHLKAGEGGAGGASPMTAEQMEQILADGLEEHGLSKVPATIKKINTRVAEMEQRLQNDPARLENPSFWGTEVFNVGISSAHHRSIDSRIRTEFAQRGTREVFPGQHAAQAFRCIFLAALQSKTGSSSSPAEHALRLHGEDHPVYQMFTLQDDQLRSDRVARVGVTIMDRMLPGVVEFLRPRSVFLAASPLVVPLQGGKATYLVQDSGTSFGYVETEDSIPDRTSVSFAERAMVAKILKGVVVFSLRAMERSDVVTDAFILNDMLAGASSAIDDAGLLSDGTLARPLGISNLIDNANAKTAVVLDNSMTNATLIQNVNSDLRVGKNAIATADITPQRLNYFCSWRDFDFFAEQDTDGGGGRRWPEVTASGTLGGIPLNWTTRIGTDGDPGGIGSTLILVDMAEVMFAEEQAVNVRTSFEGSLTDTSQDSGSYHLFERSAGAMLLEAFHDIHMRRSKAGYVWNDLNWGGPLVAP